MLIITGNKNKQNEIKQFIDAEFLNIDLKEVYSNNIDIIIHKIKEALKFTDSKEFMVEDITMYINDVFYPDIKWKQDKLKEGDKVKIILTVGKFENGLIKVFTKELNGIVHLNKCDKYHFGFDNIIFINNICLGDYKIKNPLRKLYLDIIENKINPFSTIEISNVQDWNGKYQEN